ncbi:GLPGLI family protein [Aquirufa ecclesiirivi]|uniref:GLPGLI family protein n=1 Tax=Aquirufa ecclesiirivi TaxID=2715124 RepID=UPI0023D84AE9|nr:GLPGLI family protein [Aquirufa ecclesiirivi]MDF0692269.1 GLPGLI family protein [Aquirufa ecclesiirivi]
MKVKTIFLIGVFSICSIILFAQNVVLVTYEENQSGKISITKLTVNNNQSIYKTTSIKGFEETPGELKKIVDNLEKSSIYLVKLFRENKILYPAIRVFDQKKQIILDSLNCIKWKLITGTTNLKYLGRKVKTAKCHFRGRNYSAMYCPDIPISDGPFKFNGLPGLILKISSDDNFVSYSATKIEFSKDVKFDIAPKYFTNQIKFWDYVNLAKKEMAADYQHFLSTLPPEQRNVKFDVKLDRVEMVF